MNATTHKMTKTVLECELRLAWGEVECAMRHGQQPNKRLCDWIARLERELKARK